MNLFTFVALLAADASGEAAVTAGTAAVKKVAAASGGPGWMAFAIVLACLILPFMLGKAIARAIRLQEYGLKIGMTIFTVVLALCPFAWRISQGKSWKDAFKFGIDLAGGTNMTFIIDYDALASSGKQKSDITAEVMDKMKAAVSKRINISGTEEINVRTVGKDRIEVIVPGADKDDVEAIKNRITNLGSLEFTILACQRDDRHKKLIELGLKMDPNGEKDVHKTDDQGNKVLIGRWIPVANESNSKKTFKSMGMNDYPVTREVDRDGIKVPEFLVEIDSNPERWITGHYLRRATPQLSETGEAVGFTFNQQGGYLFQQLTSKYQPTAGSGLKSRLAIVLNGAIHSAPTINSVIGASGQIDGRFTHKEILELCSVLNAGALAVPLKKQPVSEYSISPLLGSDVQKKGFLAMELSLLAVFVVTAGYYLWAGVVADICLVFNVILLAGIMSWINATFTLPGLAGFVLSVGMAVDTNVLIFERMREELQRGSSMRMTIKNGFDKAWTTIIDSNLTTLISAVVLYIVGTDQVKGFAVTLFIGIIVSLFTAIYIGRMIFEIWERKRWMTELKMLNLVVGRGYDFVGKTRLCVIVSAFLIVSGMAVLAYRGGNNLDIDFSGGSLVTFQFDGDAPSFDEATTALKLVFPEPSLEELKVPGADGKIRDLFRLRVGEKNPDIVAAGVNKAFEGGKFQLLRQHLTIGAAETTAEKTEPPEFVGGQLVTVKTAQPDTAQLLSEKIAEITKNNGLLDASSQLLISAPNNASATTKANEFSLKFKPTVSAEVVTKVTKSLQGELEKFPLWEEVNKFDSAVAEEAKINGLWALFLSCVGIILYLWVRFQGVTFGLAAVIALLHDVLIVMGFIAIGAVCSGSSFARVFLGLTDFKIDLGVVAAILTIIGYSVNDTIVVFDRIREGIKSGRRGSVMDIMNASINETLSRTIITGGVILLTTCALFFLGGPDLADFALVILIGVLVGTYSSVFVASPIVLWWSRRGGQDLRQEINRFEQGEATA